ncbi:carboxypeptidase-like regulatory domain-containing protein [Aquimarina gracilis]|uniref:Carboxypeptidase-like regulatory domain-containing protein n=1 Tax=Aquimarina gracilis TaxID=874422 RepID=A0ABU5ZUN5_9FLAO|nr:carboxypeptidase-like regulatory domain-containing protein [Aquimarina gracilis]MEB3345709.1 carboxypeptidase-like regulatory domain-containing protein [Aquimarina gracilis]
MNFKIKLLFITLILSQISLIAQESYSLSGKITEENGVPIPGVNVIVTGTNNGTSSDFDGEFQIQVKNDEVLQISYIGYTTQTIIVSGQKRLEITLKEDAATLEQVVVIGYGTQSRKNLTGSVAKVSGELIQNRAVPRLDDAIVGKVAGIRVQAVNPEAGGAPKITVRGPGSISGDSSPLIVVDGIALGTDPDLLGSLDSNNIQSIEVLKDASSVAIFGSRGANGVIIVTLKEGKSGDTQFAYNTYTGFKFVPKNDQYNSSVARWRRYINGVQSGLDPNSTEGQRFQENLDRGNALLTVASIITEANGGETDWQDVMIDGGIIQSHSFSATGGTPKTKFNASLGYVHDEGVLLTDDFKRYNARVKINSKSKNNRIRFGLNLNGQNTLQRRFPVGIETALRQSPWVPTRLNDATLGLVNVADSRGSVIFSEAIAGDYSLERMFDHVFTQDGAGILRDDLGNPVLDFTRTSGGISLSTTGDANALAKVLERKRTKEETKILGSSFLEFKLAEGLKLKQTIYGDFRFTRDYDKRGILHHQNRSGRTQRDERVRTVTHYGVESLLTYKNNLGAHTIDAIGGFSFDDFDYTEQSTTGLGFTNDITDNIPAANVGEQGSFTRLGNEKLISYFGRLNYDFDDKYLLSISARTDGSSRFGENTKFGFFPAASVGWRISGERFLQDSNVITDLKIRASYGVSGSNAIDRNIFSSLYRSLSTLSPVVFDGQPGLKPTVIANPDLGWERLIEFNPGIDLEIANGAFGLSADYYTRSSDDLILFLPVPSVTGARGFLQNSGEVKNEGIEIEARSNIVSRPNFKWNVSAQFTKNTNELVDFGKNDGLISSIEDDKRATQFIANEGQPITSFYGFVVDREVPFQYLNNPFYPINAQSQDVYVKDLNGDGIIDDEDRTELGNPYPDFEWGFSSNFNFYGVDLSFSLQGSHGAEVRVSDLEYQRNEFSSNQDVTSDVPNREFLRKRIFTNDHIQDASFVALRNIGVGYTLPKDITEKMNIDKLRIYLNGENLIYITADDYFGFNPEGANYNTRGANLATTFGYQRGAPPIPRVVSMGLNLQF